MFDCAVDVLAYHDDEVTLAEPERAEMRSKRNANRNRLKKGLEKNNKPQPSELKSQGSYAMKTMVQHPERDYDIDDGAYFLKETLVGPRGGEMSALDARQMVRDAVDDGSFKTKPEARLKCVRVYYDAGYHVDIPVYRTVVSKDSIGNETTHHELAGSEWKRSDARDVTAWFDDQNTRQSPDELNGRQLRRITRLIKKFAKSRESWSGQILSGFGITILVTECYRKSESREDSALYDTMKAMRDRLNWNLVVKHPVTPDHTITNGDDDPKARFLRDKLSDSLRWLEPLFANDCTRKKALKCWDDVFDTKYFTERDNDESKSSAASNSGLLTSGMLKSFDQPQSVPAVVRKEGGGRYA